MPQDFTFGLFHLARILVALVIVAEEMQKTVHGKMGNMMGKRLVLAAGFTLDGFEGQHDIAEMRFRTSVFRRKRQYVRGLIDAPPIPVKQAYRRIIGQDDSKLRPAC